MGVENFQNAPAGSKRSAKRARVLLAAKLQTPLGEVDARLRDLSRKGALSNARRCRRSAPRSFSCAARPWSRRASPGPARSASASNSIT